MKNNKTIIYYGHKNESKSTAVIRKSVEALSKATPVIHDTYSFMNHPAIKNGFTTRNYNYKPIDNCKLIPTDKSLYKTEPKSTTTYESQIEKLWKKSINKYNKY